MVKTRYRVWLEQINQQWVEVIADSEREAMDKARRKWRRDVAQPMVTYIEELEGE